MSSRKLVAIGGPCPHDVEMSHCFGRVRPRQVGTSRGSVSGVAESVRVLGRGTRVEWRGGRSGGTKPRRTFDMMRLGKHVEGLKPFDDESFARQAAQVTREGNGIASADEQVFGGKA